MENLIEYKPFSKINLADNFFDSLKGDYKEFELWFNKKSLDNSFAYVLEINNKIQAFLYLKVEEETITDVTPNLPKALRVKVGTFKVNPHGTRLGERFIKKILDYTISKSARQIYLTIFEKHQALINLLEKYGFLYVANKATPNGVEKVYLKELDKLHDDIILDYPLFKKDSKKYLLSIYPEFHTRLFPDSILNNEQFHVIEDVSYTNSIHKIYVCAMDVSNLRKGDILVIYRTKAQNDPGAAFHRSVVTSICIVEDVRKKNDFNSFADYLSYCQPFSVFNSHELLEWYNKKTIFTIKMTYNAALQKRITRGNLLTNMGFSDGHRWGFFEITDEQFDNILKLGKVDGSLIINQT